MRLSTTILTGLTLALATAVPAAATTTRTPALSECESSTPSLFSAGVISHPDKEEYRIAFTSNNKTAYFSRADYFFPASRQATILETHWTGDAWSTPTTASFSGTYSDIDPWLTPDGQRLYFSSIRPVDGVARDDIDIWFVDRLPSGGWSQARHAGDINVGGTTAAGDPVDDVYPTVGPDGWLYTGSNRDGGQGGWDIWRAAPHGDGTFGPAENVGSSVNTAGWEFNPTFAPDGQHLLFTRIADFAPPWGDLQAAAVTTSPTGEAAALGMPHGLDAINTAEDEFNASFSGDGRTFFYVHNELTETSNGDFHCLPVKALGL